MWPYFSNKYVKLHVCVNFLSFIHTATHRPPFSMQHTSSLNAWLTLSFYRITYNLVPKAGFLGFASFFLQPNGDQYRCDKMQVKGKRIFMFVLMLVQCAFIVTFVLCVEYDNSAKPNIDENLQSSESADGKSPDSDRVMQTYPSKWRYVHIRYTYMYTCPSLSIAPSLKL